MQKLMLKYNNWESFLMRLQREYLWVTERKVIVSYVQYFKMNPDHEKKQNKKKQYQLRLWDLIYAGLGLTPKLYLLKLTVGQWGSWFDFALLPPLPVLIPLCQLQKICSTD